MATPHVTGAAALLFSLKPAASVTEVRQALLGSVDPLPSLAGKTTSGGRLDIGAATDLFDAVPPPAPVLAATTPPSPSAERSPRLLGLAQAGTKVEVYAGADCWARRSRSAPRHTCEPGIAVSVAADARSEFSARAIDSVPLTSSCSAPISYLHRTPAVDPGGGEGSPGEPGGGGAPPTTPGAGGGAVVPSGAAPGPAPKGKPGCIVPKLVGKNLSRAKAALAAAGCKVGVVHRRPSASADRRAAWSGRHAPRRGGGPPTDPWT